MMEDNRSSIIENPPAPKLAICMPTYNFAGYISEAVRSILDQDGSSEVELIVFDGASTDNTQDVMIVLCREYPQITYIRAPKKGGIDQDIANTIEYAIAPYCWLFSSDDVMYPNALRTILTELASGFDAYLIRHMECTQEMRPILAWPSLRVSSPEEFDLSDIESRQRYFSLAETTEPFFSFMGGIIIKRDTWNSAPPQTEFLGTCWAHAARIFDAIPGGLSVKYLPRPLLGRRRGNDSFAEGGTVQRFRIAVEGFNKISDHFFGHNSIEAFHIRRVLRKEFSLGHILIAKAACREFPEIENRDLLNTLVQNLYEDRSFGNILGKFLYYAVPTPSWVVQLMRYIHNIIRN
jgi:abequosyltransferase